MGEKEGITGDLRKLVDNEQVYFLDGGNAFIGVKICQNLSNCVL